MPNDNYPVELSDEGIDPPVSATWPCDFGYAGEGYTEQISDETLKSRSGRGKISTIVQKTHEQNIDGWKLVQAPSSLFCGQSGSYKLSGRPGDDT